MLGCLHMSVLAFTPHISADASCSLQSRTHPRQPSVCTFPPPHLFCRFSTFFVCFSSNYFLQGSNNCRRLLLMSLLKTYGFTFRSQSFISKDLCSSPNWQRVSAQTVCRRLISKWGSEIIAIKKQTEKAAGGVISYSLQQKIEQNICILFK